MATVFMDLFSMLNAPMGDNMLSLLLLLCVPFAIYFCAIQCVLYSAPPQFNCAEGQFHHRQTDNIVRRFSGLMRAVRYERGARAPVLYSGPSRTSGFRLVAFSIRVTCCCFKVSFLVCSIVSCVWRRRRTGTVELTVK